MKSLLSLILCCAMISSSFASSGRTSTLKEAIDDLNYSLQVEWDQRDPEFYGQQMKIFKDKVTALNLNGLSHSQIIAEALRTMPESSQKNDMIKSIKTFDVDKISDSELQQRLAVIASKSKQSGASWEGDMQIIVPVALVVAVVAVVIFVVVSADKRAQKKAQKEYDDKVAAMKKQYDDAVAASQQNLPQTNPGDSVQHIPEATGTAPAPVPVTPSYQCKMVNTCVPGTFGMGIDDIGVPLGTYGGTYNVNACGYQFLCGNFL